MSIVVFSSWIFFSLVVGFMAENRGRSPVAAMFVSLIFSPLIGIIAVLLSGKNQTVLDNRAVRTGKAKRCPRCSELVKPKALVCKHCGNDLAAKVEPVAAESEVVTAE